MSAPSSAMHLSRNCCLELLRDLSHALFRYAKALAECGQRHGFGGGGGEVLTPNGPLAIIRQPVFEIGHEPANRLGQLAAGGLILG